jgi:Ca-activated chloride channel family protein
VLVFDRPWAFAAFALPAVLVFLGRVSGGRFGAVAFPLAGGPIPQVPVLASILRALRGAAFWLGYSAAVIAASGPSLASQRIVFLERGAEAVLVLDVSPSMAASDFEPTRLDAAKAIIGEFLSARRNETVGLVAFGGEAALVCPPTSDYRSVASRLAELKPGAYGEDTAIGSGLATALAHIARSSAVEKRIILLTDGESNAGSIDPLTAARSLSRFGVEFSVVGVGSAGDIPVTYTDPRTGGTKSGLYRSGFDRASMEELAAAGKGEYFPAADRSALAAAFSSLSERSLSPARSRSERVERGLVGFFAAASLALVTLARIASLAGGGWRP